MSKRKIEIHASKTLEFLDNEMEKREIYYETATSKTARSDAYYIIALVVIFTLTLPLSFFGYVKLNHTMPAFLFSGAFITFFLSLVTQHFNDKYKFRLIETTFGNKYWFDNRGEDGIIGYSYEAFGGKTFPVKLIDKLQPILWHDVSKALDIELGEVSPDKKDFILCIILETLLFYDSISIEASKPDTQKVIDYLVKRYSYYLYEGEEDKNEELKKETAIKQIKNKYNQVKEIEYYKSDYERDLRHHALLEEFEKDCKQNLLEKV